MKQQPSPKGLPIGDQGQRSTTINSPTLISSQTQNNTSNLEPQPIRQNSTLNDQVQQTISS
jgi:uncharacterized protein (DUF1499 family)